MPATARTRDINGYVEIRDNPISKAGVYPYSGAQLGLGGEAAGRIFRVYRPPEELADPECIASFRLLPLVDEHPAGILGDEELGATPAEVHGIQGCIGEQIYFDPPYLRANLRLLSESIKRAIDMAGKVELSPGYRCQYDLTPGVTPEGEPYDAVQRKIRGNHLALVEEGRTGPDVAVLDHLKITLDAKEVAPMADENENTQDAEGGEGGDILATAKAALETLKPLLEASAEVKAMLAELMGAGDPAAAGDQDPAPTQPAPAMDEPTMTPAALDAALSKALQPINDRLSALEAGRTALDAAVISSLAERDALVGKVTPFVGTFDSARMTVQQVAEYAAEKLGIPVVVKGQERVALDAWLHGRTPDMSKPTIAADGANGKGIFDTWGAQ